MSITDELREWMRVVLTDDDPAHAIADRIDAEYQKAEDEWKAKDGQTWLRGYAECHAELMEGNEVIAADLEKAGWDKLPVDADGVPWYRGSRVIDPKDPNGKVNTVWIAGDNTLVTDDHLFIFRANELRHYQPPTVEDVLREFALRAIRESEGNYGDLDETCAEYAKRLRLAGDAE